MQGLQVQLVIALDRHETHPWPGHSFSDRLGIDIVALVRLYVGLYILRRHEPHCMPLLLQRPAKKMGSSTSFHTDQFDLQVRRKVQQLLARKLLAQATAARSEEHTSELQSRGHLVCR